MAKSHKKKRLEARFGKKVKSSPAELEKNKSVATEPVKVQLESTSAIGKFYETYYKQLLIIPFLMLFAAFLVLGVSYATTGQLVGQDITLKGGVTIIITTDMVSLDGLSASSLEASLQEQFPDAVFDVRTLRQFTELAGFEISADMTGDEEIVQFRESLTQIIPGLTPEQVGNNIGIKGATIGASFFKQITWAMLAALVLMGIVIFIQFRVFVPSFAVILAAVSNIVVTLAIVSLLDIKLSTAGIAAFLMIIGYSVDTDVLLSTRVLKNKTGSVFSRIISAMKTGVTMNVTTLAAITVALLVSESQTISQIMTILFIGLWVDMINTWIQNAGILRWYTEKKERESK
jgi:preprotein translocase subunit SecF